MHAREWPSLCATAGRDDKMQGDASDNACALLGTLLSSFNVEISRVGVFLFLDIWFEPLLCVEWYRNGLNVLTIFKTDRDIEVNVQ